MFTRGHGTFIFCYCSLKHTKFYIAVETFGFWGPRGLKFIKEIGRNIKEKTGNKKCNQSHHPSYVYDSPKGKCHNYNGQPWTSKKTWRLF